MELVYLWVEKYKNIENQGFNFSSKFECKFHDEYDKHGKLKNNCNLTIDKNNNYIPDFFTKNINISAIVGKNGSGKSSIFELIIESVNTFLNILIKPNHIKDTFTYYYPSIFLYTNFVLFFYDKENNQLFSFWKTQLKTINIINNTNIEINQEILEPAYSVNKLKQLKGIRRGTLPPLNDNFNEKKFKHDCHKVGQKILLVHYDYSFTKFRPYKTHQTFISHNAYSNTHEYFNDDTLIQCIPEKSDILFDTDIERFNVIESLLYKTYIDDTNKYFTPYKITLNKKGDNRIYKDFNNLWNIDLRTSLEYLQDVIYKYIISLVRNYDRNSDELLSKIKDINSFSMLQEYININKDKFENFFDYDTPTHHKRDSKKIQEMIEAYNYLELLNKKGQDVERLLNFRKLNVNIKYLNENNIQILTKIPLNIFRILVLDKSGKDYNDLSNGEKSALRIRFYIEKIISTSIKNNFIILLDEPANDMHPQWQKKLLSYLIDIFKNRKQNFHFIFTSHSPFMISDLPKDNIIFLKDGKVDNVTHQQTFGQNIHTLLSNSFFMEDGLMGEFAKGKINEIKRFYEVFTKYQDNQNIKKAYKWIYLRKRKKFWQIQSIIGEPFLKTVIKNYLDEIQDILFEEKAQDLDIEKMIAIHGKDKIMEMLKNHDKD